MKVRTEITCAFVNSVEDDAAREQIADHCFAVVGELINLEGAGCTIADPDVSIDSGAKTVTFAFDVEGATLDECRTTLLASLRTAIHTAGGNTPSWEKAWGTIEYNMSEDFEPDGELSLT